jgi:TP901 family phage tail tape measure protein
MSDKYTWSFQAGGQRETSALFSVIEKLDNLLQKVTSRNYHTPFRDMGTASRSASASFSSLSSAIADVSKETIKTASGATTITTEMDKMGKVLRRTVEDTTSVNGTLSKTKHVFDGQGNSIKQTSETISSYDAKTKQVSISIRGMGSATTSAQKSQHSLFQILTRAAGVWNTWNKAVDFAAKRLRQLTRAVTSVFTSVQTIGGGFQRTRATMEVLAKGAGSTGQEIAALTAKTKELGRTTEFTAQDAANGAVTLLKAGETASSAYEKLGTALDAALATGLKIDKVAAIGNHAFKIFGDNLGKVGDRAASYDTAMRVMIASSNAADVSVSELDRSVVRGGNILAQLGVPLTRVTTALGLMANKGVIGSTAMRQLSIGVKRLVDGTTSASNALKKLGISAIDDQGNFRDLGVVMQEISTALKLQPQNEQIKLMKDLFGVADRSMGALLDAGISGFDKLEDQILKNLDVMDELKEKRADTMIGSYKTFASAVEGVYIELTEVLTIPIQEFWSRLGNILNTVTDRIMTVGKRMNESGATLEDWIDAIKGGSFNGIFSGLAEELSPELSQLKILLRGGLDAGIELLKGGLVSAAADIWNSLFTFDIETKALQLGLEMGKSLLSGLTSSGVGMAFAATMGTNLSLSMIGAVLKVKQLIETIKPAQKAAEVAGSATAIVPSKVSTAASALAVPVAVGVGGGVLANAAIQQVTKHYERSAVRADQEHVRTLTHYLQEMLEKKSQLQQQPLLSKEDEARVNRINQQISQTGDELTKLGATGPQGDFLANYYQKQVSKAKDALSQLEKKQEDVVTAPEKVKKPASKTDSGDWGKIYEDWTRFKQFKKETGSKAEFDTYDTSKDFELWSHAQQGKVATQQKKAQTLSYQDQLSAMMSQQGLSSEEAARQLRIQDAMQRAAQSEKRITEANIPAKLDFSSMTDDQLQETNDLLSKKKELIDAERQHKENLEASTSILKTTQIEINNVGTAFKQWLLNPIDTFRQKMLSIKQQWAEVGETLRSKKLDLSEKLGLLTTKEVTQDRKSLLQQALRRDQGLLREAQTPEERQKLREQMSTRAESLAELTEGSERRKYGKLAITNLTLAGKENDQSQRLQLRAQEMERENALNNVQELQSLVSGAKTSGAKAGYLEQLQSVYQSLGSEYRLQGVQAQADWQKAKADAAAEESENLKRVAESSELSVELLQRAVSALEDTAQTTKNRMQIPPDPEFAT